MHTMLRLSLCALALAGAFYGLDLAHPDWIQDLGHEAPQLSELAEELGKEEQIRDDLLNRLNIARMRGAAKRRIAQQLLAGQLSLLEAAARFRDLDRDLPNGCINIFRRFVEGRTDDERYCHQVIGAAAGELFLRPPEAAAIRARLNAELQDMQEHGPLHLPV